MTINGNGAGGKPPPLGSPERPLNGSLGAGDGSREAPVAETPPAEIVELAASCRDYAFAAIGADLDWTPETLPILDHYVKGARDEVRERPETLPLLTRAIGAYFGEVTRKQIDAFWRVPSADAHLWSVCGRRVYLAFNPVGVAYEALLQSSEHDGPSAALRIAPDAREGVEQRLVRHPPVGDEEYYLLSTRLEVIEVVAEQLREQMRAAGEESTVYDEEDYEDE